MAKQYTVVFLALAAQALLVQLSAAKPIPNSSTEPQSPTLDARCLNGAVEKRCGDNCEFDTCCGCDKCDSCGPCSFVHGFGNCGGFDKCDPCGPCSFVHGFGTCGDFDKCDPCGPCSDFSACGGFDKCDSCGPCSFIHGFGAFGFPCDGCNSFGACGRGACPCGCDTCCLKKRNLPKQKRGGIPYGSGFGYPYGSGYDFGYPYGYGAYGNGACGTCGPSVVSSNTVCGNADQCCNNVAFRNSDHVAASVCNDCDTAYCANKNACSDDNVAKSFVNIA